MSDKPVTYAFGFVDTGTSVHSLTVEAITMKVDNRTTRPLIQNVLGFAIETTPDGQGLILTAPPGKVFDLGSNRFQVSPDGKKLEVRVK
jgi:hypothetical protein